MNNPISTDRIPPHSETSEQGVLGGVLLDGNQFGMLKADMNVVGEAFYVPANRMIWEAMEAVALTGRSIDIYTVAAELTRSGALDKCGGMAYMDGMAERCPIASHVGHYAEEVMLKFGLRACLAASRKIESDALNPEAEDGRTVAAAGIMALCEVMKSKEPDVGIMEDIELSIREWDAAAELRREGKVVPMKGLATGISEIDRLTNGMQPGVIVVGARESTGKTTLEGQIAAHVMRADFPVLRITRDSERKLILERDIAREAQVNLALLPKGFMTAIHRERIIKARELIRGWKQKVVMDKWKMPDVCAAIRADFHRRGTRLVTIDFLQQFQTGNSRLDQDQNGKYEAIMGMLKNLTFEIHVPIMVLAQFARDKDGQKGRFGGNWLTQKPIMADFKGSGAIEQLADVALLLSKVGDVRDENGDLGMRTLLGCDVAKNKQGPQGSLFLNFHRPYFTMEEVTENQHTAVTKFLRDELKGEKWIAKGDDPPYYDDLEDALKRASWQGAQQ